MTELRIQMLEDLGAEFARVAADHERAPRRHMRRLALALSAVVLLGGGVYAVPATRAALEDLTGSFAGWVEGDGGQAPGRALRPGEDAPAWVRESGGRLIAEAGGAGLYVLRERSGDGDMRLSFAVGEGFGVSASIEDWRKRFAEHKLVILGPASVDGKPWDARGRFPLMGVTARSVDRVQLTFASGPPIATTGVQGGFVLMVDARRALRELVGYDAAGHELERVDASYIHLQKVCFDERGCPPGRWVRP